MSPLCPLFTGKTQNIKFHWSAHIPQFCKSSPLLLLGDKRMIFPLCELSYFRSKSTGSKTVGFLNTIPSGRSQVLQHLLMSAKQLLKSNGINGCYEYRCNFKCTKSCKQIDPRPRKAIRVSLWFASTFRACHGMRSPASWPLANGSSEQVFLKKKKKTISS